MLKSTPLITFSVFLALSIPVLLWQTMFLSKMPCVPDGEKKFCSRCRLVRDHVYPSCFVAGGNLKLRARHKIPSFPPFFC